MNYILIKLPDAASGIDPCACCSSYVGFGSQLDVDADGCLDRNRCDLRGVLALGS